MNYRELQQKLKEYKQQGFTTIKLNQEACVLEREYNRITNILKYAPKQWAIRKLRGEQHPDPEPVQIKEATESQVAKTEPEANETTATQEVNTVASFNPKSLRLVVSQKWFKMIASGEKKEEYRAIKPYYESRFKKQYTHIKFEAGYASDVPTATVELLGIEKGIPRPEWSDPELFGGSDQEVFILKLGEIVDVNFAAKTLNAKPVEWVRDYQDDLQGNYRIDKSEEDEDGELWLERLNDEGEPAENYVSVSPEQLEQLKANGQIWEYSREIERWVPLNESVLKFSGQMQVLSLYPQHRLRIKRSPVPKHNG